MVLNLDELKKRKAKIKEERQKWYEDDLQILKERMSSDNLRPLEFTSTKGASAWIATQPLASENFTLTKWKFFEIVRLRYRWHLKFLPQTCPFFQQQRVHCRPSYVMSKRWWRHLNVKDTIAKLLDQTCRDVEVEPSLISLTGERLGTQMKLGEEIRFDIAARGF